MSKRMTVKDLKDIINCLKDDVIVEITDEVMGIVAINDNFKWYSKEIPLKPEDTAGTLYFEDTTTNIPCCSDLPSIDSIELDLTRKTYEYIRLVRDVTLRHPSIDEVSASKIKKLSEEVKDEIFECKTKIEKNGDTSLFCYTSLIEAKHGIVEAELNKFVIPGGEKEYRKMKSRINGLRDEIRIITSVIETYILALSIKDGKKIKEE